MKPRRPATVPDLRGVSLDEISGERLIPAGAWEAIGAKRPNPRAIRWRARFRRCGEAMPRESMVHLTGGQVGRTRCGVQIPDETRWRIFHDDETDRPACATCARLAMEDEANKRKDAKK